MVAAAAAAADDNVASHASQPGQAGRRGEICRNRRVLGGVGWEREGERGRERERVSGLPMLAFSSRSIYGDRTAGREEGRKGKREREREKGRERDKI